MACRWGRPPRLDTRRDGVAAGLLVLVFADDSVHPIARMARCSMGFLVAVVWIVAIADEVVNVLQVRHFVTLSSTL